MKEIFDTYMDNAFGAYEQAGVKFRQFENNYKQYFPLDKKAKLLDIGVGRGEMLACMKEWGYLNYLGIDISPSTINYCQSLGLACQICDDVCAWLDKNRNTFSLITLLDVLEHIPKKQTIQYLKAIRSALRDDGMLIVQVPNLQAPDGQLHRYNDFTHEVGYIEHSLRQVLVASGFTGIQMNGFEGFVTGGVLENLRKLLRSLLWLYTRLKRDITGNLNPRILYPVFYAVARK